MFNFQTTILFPIIVAFLTTVIATPISLIFIKKLGIIDDPKKHVHPAIIHKKPIPRAGGIPLFIGVFIPSLIFLPIENITIAIFISSFICLFIGVLDDKFDLSPYLRFIVNIIAAIIVVVAGVHVPFITNPFGGILFLNSLNIPFLGSLEISFISYIVAILWIVWVINMLNWSKGVDGQMPGIVAISAIIIGVLSLRFPVLDQYSLMSATLSFIIAGASLGFLIFNFYPARIFPGYGATAIYLLLAVASIFSGAKLATAILVMGVPMTDGAFTIARRILSGRSPFWHDRKHLHHLLLSLGFGQRRIALFYWLVSAILGSLSLVLSSKGKLFAIIMLVIIAGGTILFLHFFIERNKNETGI
ncbi:MAG: undecaprenyl/decaprenyl-phosphate alpha-N-acetylglucosaminyl 1-phosphate transferase [Patescibacteria group bacterium]|nr:undecaprenyl/decaprenyl-phosphate alpha-N-acetylglucosaminyl 1-phosphate transferase [Patescibacteria group bacterium]